MRSTIVLVCRLDERGYKAYKNGNTPDEKVNIDPNALRPILQDMWNQSKRRKVKKTKKNKKK